jgi:hypothetical protein
MERDAKLMRGDGPTLFTSIRNGEGVESVIDLVLGAWKGAGSPGTAGAVGSGDAVVPVEVAEKASEPVAEVKAEDA